MAGVKNVHSKTCVMGAKKERDEVPEWWIRLCRASSRAEAGVARWLARKTARIPPRRLRVYVLLCVLALGSANAMLVGRGWKHRKGERMPVITWSPPAIVEVPRLPLGTSMREVLDSIRRDSVRRRALDSLLRARPGLADSVKRVE